MLRNVAGLILDRVDSHVRTLGSFRFTWVHSGAVGVVGCIRVSVGSLGRALCSSGSFGFALVYCGAPSIVGFIKVSLGPLGLSKGSSGSFWFRWLHSGAPRGRRVHSVSRRFIRARQDVVGFILGSRVFTQTLICVEGFIRVCVGSLGHT